MAAWAAVISLCDLDSQEKNPPLTSPAFSREISLFCGRAFVPLTSRTTPAPFLSVVAKSRGERRSPQHRVTAGHGVKAVGMGTALVLGKIGRKRGLWVHKDVRGHTVRLGSVSPFDVQEPTHHLIHTLI